MGKIQVLDEHMTNLIAAGEVIERCASVVKELVENSIDAGATKIAISLIDSGLNEIRVIDNGSGMDVYDAKMCIVPHATSKIRNQNDLFTIGTLGFRGEALPSIVAISNFKIITSVDGYHGLMMSIKGGVPLSEATIAHPKGTEIIVKNLFFNTPARLQNLQSPNVELSYITEYVSKIAIAHNDIAFNLSNNDKLLFHTSGNGNLLEVISEIYSNDIAKEMVSIFDNNGIFKVEGYISKISVTRSNKSNINLIINGRVIHNANIVNSVIAGYGNHLMMGKYPIAVIAITVDLSMVDVNVHPSKYEVRLSDESSLKEMIIKAVSDALKNTDLSVDVNPYSFSDDLSDKVLNENVSNEEYIEDFDDENEVDSDEEYNNEDYSYEDKNDEIEDSYDEIEDESDDYEENLDDNNVDEEQTDLFAFEEEKIEEYNNENIEETEVQNIQKKEYISQQFSFNDDEIVGSDDTKEKLGKLYFIGQLFGTYILAQNDEEFYMIDQHAANERINYEKIKNSLSNSNNSTYELLIPFTLTFSQSETILVNAKMEEINRLGIVLEEFGENTFVVREIPIWIFRGREKDFVEEIITKVINDKCAEKTVFLDSLAKSLACKKSIKGNEFHSSIEIEYLLDELIKTSNPFTCPHGRPVIIRMTKQDIEKMFKRILD